MKRLFLDIDAVLFDLDGTLVETGIDFPLMRREMIRMAAESGVRENELPDLDILGIVRHVEERLGLERGREFRGRAYGILEEIEMRHSRETREVKYARELLEAVRLIGAKVGVVTRNCRPASEMSVKSVGLVPDLILCREDVKLTKPHPEQLLTALELLKAAPDRSVMVGDHLMDVLAGKAAGMRTVGILTPGREPDFFNKAAPDAVVRSLKEILDALVAIDS